MFFNFFEVGETRCGHLADRSAYYLYYGKPAIVQDTGFSKHPPCGLGLIAVNNCEEAAAAIGYVCQDYDKHAKAAREIAAEYFTPERVIGKIMDTI